MLEILERGVAALIILALLVLFMFIALPPQSPIPGTDFSLPSPAWLFWSVVLLPLALTGYTHVRRVPGWTSLREVLQHDSFKLSYFALAVIPCLVYVMKAKYFGVISDLSIPLNAKISYFSALSFAIASIIFAIAVPNLSRPSNQYLEVGKTLNDDDKPFVRWLCLLAFTYGLLFLLIVLYRSAKYVYFA